MANQIKGLTVEIGGDTTKLGKALESVNKKSRDLSSELGEINRMLKLDPGNTELLAQKQQVLAEAISNTTKKLETLKDAEKQVQEQFEKGEVSEAQYRSLQREILATEKKLDSYKKAMDETANAARDMGKQTETAGDKAEEASREMDKAEESADEMGGSMAEAAKTGATALAAAATAAVGAIVGLAEATREYRTDQARLESGFKSNGHSAETAYKTYSKLQGVLGDTGKSVEAATNLSALTKSEEELNRWTTILIGANGRWNESLPVEALAESSNETIRTGQVTGNLADAINWAAAENENFGVTMKENIEFTELSQEELEKLTDAQKKEYEARKAQYEEIQEYNQKVAEATTAEEKFQIALDNCTTSQERQKLITDTLSDLYLEAGENYLEANEDLIKANEANERITKSLAEMGEAVEPAVTDFKELGAEILENMEEPIKSASQWLRNTFIPGLRDFGNWVRTNGPAIGGTVAGVATAVVGFTAATSAATIATNAQAAAQKALNLVMSASPVGLVLTGITALTVGIVAYATAAKDSYEPTQHLTDAELELLDAANQAAEAFDAQREATEKTMSGIDAQMGHVSDLATELQGLADASGNVQEKDQARVDFILGQLNEALGTEYKMVDGVIQKYGELTTSIEEVIKQKTANALLEAGNADYVKALQEEADAMEAVEIAQKEYDALLQETNKAREEYNTRMISLQKEYDAAMARSDYAAADALVNEKNRMEDGVEALEASLKEKGDNLKKYQDQYKNYRDTILNYEDAQVAALEGSYQEAQDILLGKKNAYEDYSAAIDRETAKVLKTLADEAEDARLKAEEMKKNWAGGAAGFSYDFVVEAENAYKEAMGKFQNAYNDAYGIGGDAGQGLIDGLLSKQPSLESAATSMIKDGLMKPQRVALDSHSPSRKMKEIGHDAGDGLIIGIDEKTPEVAEVARNQSEAMLEAYEEPSSYTVLRDVALKDASRQAQTYQVAAQESNGMLEKILEAIKAGQVVVLDGNKLVGGTAQRMDKALGLERILAERGAK